jgi:anti-sigma B factor antagonist
MARARVPEDTPHQCPSCGHDLVLECSAPFGDDPCPRCQKPLSFVVGQSFQRVVILRFGQPRLHELEIAELDRQVDEVRGVPRIVLDFGNVLSISSTALGRLITWQKAVISTGGKLRLCRVRPKIYEVLISTRLDKVFQVYPDEQSALDSF